MHHFSEKSEEDKNNTKINVEGTNNYKNKMFRNKSFDVNNNESNNGNFQFSFKNFFKGLFVVSLPHITLICIFLFYFIVGSSILREIESNKDDLTSNINNNINSKIPLDTIIQPIATTLSSSPKTKNQIKTIHVQYNLNEINAKLKTYQASFNNIRTNYININKDLNGINEKLKSFQDHIVLNNQEFMKECNKIIKQQFNSSEIGKESGLNFNTNLKINDNSDLEGVKFISELYDKQKKNMSVINIFKSISKHLSDYKTQLKTNLNKNLKNMVETYVKKQNNFKKKYIDLISEQEIIYKKNQEFFNSIKLEELVINQNDLQKVEETNEEINTPSTVNNNEQAKEEQNEPVLEQENEAKEDESIIINKSNYISNNNRKIDWQFSTSVYFIGSLLTTIGYGDVSPQTILGKLFTMIYLIIGVPLTLILLADFGSIFTRFVKFLYAFLTIVYEEGYFDSLKKKQIPFTGLLSFFSKSNKDKKKGAGKKNANDSESSDEKNDPDQDDQDSNQSTFEALCEIALNCMENNDDTFDLSLGFLFSVVFIYLSFGAIISSRVANWSIFNGYYFSLLSLTKIGLGDLVISNTKFMLLSCGYTLFGLAFFDLTINCLQEKLRMIIVRNGQHAINEIIKFFNQFGYNWSPDSVNFNLAIAGNFKLNKKVTVVETNNNEQDQTEQSTKDLHLRSNKISMKKMKAMNDYGGYYMNEVAKCDKQTQITTLLCSKFKLEKAQSLEALYAPQTIAPVRPNTKYPLVSYRSHEIIDYNPIKEHNEEEEEASSRESIINKSITLISDRMISLFF